jgi:hypothetical protein
MGFLNGNALSGGAILEFFHDGSFEVTNKELRHRGRVISLIASVKSGRAAGTERPGAGCDWKRGATAAHSADASSPALAQNAP